MQGIFCLACCEAAILKSCSASPKLKQNFPGMPPFFFYFNMVTGFVSAKQNWTGKYIAIYQDLHCLLEWVVGCKKILWGSGKKKQTAQAPPTKRWEDAGRSNRLNESWDSTSTVWFSLSLYELFTISNPTTRDRRISLQTITANLKSIWSDCEANFDWSEKLARIACLKDPVDSITKLQHVTVILDETSIDRCLRNRSGSRWWTSVP